MVLISIPVYFYLRIFVAPAAVETGWSSITVPDQFNATGFVPTCVIPCFLFALN